MQSILTKHSARVQESRRRSR